MAVERVYARPSERPGLDAAGTDARAGAPVPDLVVVGAASRDLTDDTALGWRLGGGVTYGALAAARLGLRVGCLLGLDREAESAPELAELVAAGVAIQAVRLEHGPAFENLEHEGRRRQRWLSRSDRVPPAELPHAWRGVAAFLLASVAGEIADEWAAAIGPGTLVAVAWQGLLRTFGADGWVDIAPPRSSPLLSRADLVGVSVTDVAPGSSLADLAVPLSPDATLVLTAAHRGGYVLHEGRVVRYPALRAGRLVDPTGAGDVFLAALVAAWLRAGTPPWSGKSLRFAAAAASCVVEAGGLAGVPTLSETAARLRARPDG